MACQVVIHRDITVIQESTEILLLVDAVGKSFSDHGVMSDLAVFELCPRKIVIRLRQKDSLSLLQPVGRRKVIETVIDMHHFSDPAISFLDDGSFSGFCPDRFDEISERPSCMDPASGDLKADPFPLQLMVDLVAVSDSCTGKLFKEFPRVVSLNFLNF